MSANLYWEPTQRKKHDINVGAPSSFMDTLGRVFGRRTPTLGMGDIVKLETLRDATEIPEWASVYAELIDAIEKCGEIQISAEY
jgi:hypothetical protein